MNTLQSAPGVEYLKPYKTPPLPYPVDLLLAGNEGAAPPQELLAAAAELPASLLQRYPAPKPFEALLAARLGVDPACVLVTAGADEALDRACRAMLTPQRTVIMPEPTFVMLPAYAALARARAVCVPWPSGPYPTDQVIDAVDESTAAIVVVSPNNPTGAVATAEDLVRLSKAAPHAMIIVDLAYTEFADKDLTSEVLALPNAVAFRTLSKAWGIAGLRVGYAVGPARLIGWMRATGSPYSVSALSLAIAANHLERNQDRVASFIARIQQERAELEALLDSLGARPLRSQGNFVYCRPPQGSLALRDGLCKHGIAVRAWPGHPVLHDGVRITCPGNPTDFQRLTDAIKDVLQNQGATP